MYNFSRHDPEISSLTSLPESETEVVTNSGRVHPEPRITIKWSHGNCNPKSSLSTCKDKDNIHPPTSKLLIPTLKGGRKRKMKSNKSKKYKYRKRHHKTRQIKNKIKLK